MSYDVQIGDFDSNMTSNIGEIFYDHLCPESGIAKLHEMKGQEAAECLAEFFNSLKSECMRLWVEDDIWEPRLCAKYDAENGWGSTVGAIIWAGQIMAACHRNPRKKVQVSR